MKTLLLSLFLATAAVAQTSITTYNLTKADCSPTSMLMLFPPYPGFVCIPSSTVLITGPANSYDVEIQYQHADGRIETGSTILRTAKGEATWVIYEEGVKVLKVTATPQIAGTPETRVF